MGWTLSIGTVKGTEVRVHWTFLLFLMWIGGALFAEGGWGAALGGLIFFLLLFLCVVLHEFGHIFAARRFGIRTPDVLLLPIGGVSRLERIPEEPRKELMIALAGPAVSLGIAFALILVLGGLPGIEQLMDGEPVRALLAQLAYANLFLGLFNLLPAFPMDGGRVLRALLGMRYGHARSTRIAATVGQGAAILFGIAALLMGHVILMFIALFIFLAASAEGGVAQMRGATLGLVAEDVMVSSFETLSVDAPVSAAAEALLRTDQRDFPVIDGQGRLQGVLTRDGLVKAIARGGRDTPVSGAMTADIPLIPARHSADECVSLLQQGAPAVGVVDDASRLVGLVTWDNLLEHLMIARAEGRRPAPEHRPEAFVPITARRGWEGRQ